MGNPMVPCQSCGLAISLYAKACPRCGHPIEANKPLPYAKAALVALAIFAILGLLQVAWRAIRG